MAEITAAIRKAYGFAPGAIPGDVLRQIGQSELLDRLVEADRLVRKAQATNDGTLRWGFNARARAVLGAQRRDKTQHEHNTLIAKAAQLPPGAPADALRRRAAELVEANPPARRRAEGAAVVKAVRVAKAAKIAKAAAAMADDDALR